MGVVRDNATAYALCNMARAQGDESATKALSTTTFTESEVEQGQQLSRELSKPGNFLAALDANDKRLAKLARQRAKEPDTAAAQTSSSPFPPKPAKRPGVVSCNTRCDNGDCYRTYDSGKKKHFQAKRKYNALSGDWEWDAGGC